MPVVRIEGLEGFGAEKWLPLARSQLRGWDNALEHQGAAFKTIPVPGGTIYIRQVGALQFIRIIMTGGCRYEFWTSEHVDETLSSGAPGFVGGSGTRVQFPKADVTPIISTTLVPPTVGDWNTLAPGAFIDRTSGFYTWDAWQDQRFFEHCWHPKNDGKSLVTSTQGQPPGLGNKCNWNSGFLTLSSADVGQFAADYGLDVRPTLYVGTDVTIGAPVLEASHLYWRRAAMQTVSGKQFWISTDNYGRFQVYRAGIGDTSGLVSADKYKLYTPPYPSWVTVPDSSDPLKDVNDWLWRFNADATKCVSIPFHAEPSEFYKYITAARLYFASMTAAEAATITDSAHVVLGHEDTPGLVEFSITITDTGDGDLDFDVDFEVLRSSYFGDSKRFFFDAAYFMKDQEGTGIPPDTLMTSEIECKCPLNKYEATLAIEGSPTLIYGTDGCRNMQSAMLINSNDDDLTPTEKLRVPLNQPLDIYFPTAYGVSHYGRVPDPFAYAFPAAQDDIEGTPYGPLGPLTYPGFSGSSNANPLYNTTVWAIDLATFSCVYWIANHLIQDSTFHAMAYGQEFYSKSFPISLRNVPPLESPTFVVPSAKPYQFILNQVLHIGPGLGFSVHPDGHWAFAVAGAPYVAFSVSGDNFSDDLDWISVKDGARTRYRHKDLYNKAFTQIRDYPYYTSYASNPPPAVWDNGGWRTNGIWATFR